MKLSKFGWMTFTLSLLTTLPFWFAKYPYLIDFPSHLARWHVMLADGRIPALASNYSFEWRLVGNLGTDLLAFALGKFVDIETAGLLIAGAIPAINALGVLTVTRALGRPFAVGAILSLVLIYNKSLLLGFLNYNLGIGLALIAFAAWIKGTRPIFFIPIALALWLCHIAAWGAFCIMVFGFEISQSLSLKRIISRIWPIALPVAAFLLGGTGIANPPHELADKIRMWIGAVGFRNFALDLAVMAAIYSALLIAWREKLAFDPRVGIPAILLSLSALLIPPGLGGGDLADLRLVPLALTLALLSIQAAGPPLLRLAASGFLALQVGLISTNWRAQSVKTDSALRALKFIDPGESIRVAVIENEDGLEQSAYMHTAGYATVRKNAHTNTDFSIPGVHLLKVKKGGLVDPSQVVLLSKGIGTVSAREGEKLWVFHRGYRASGVIPLYSTSDTTLFEGVGTLKLQLQ